MSDAKILPVNRRMRTAIALGLASLCIGVGVLGDWRGFTSGVGFATTRGIRTDERVDLPLDPGHPDAPKPAKPMTPVRIAARNDATNLVATLAPRVAPIETVPVSQRPDLIWDGTARTLTQNNEMIAYDVAADDIPAAADRVELIRELRDEAQTAQQAIRIVPEDRSFRAGQRVSVTVSDIKDRNAAVFVVSGNGTVEFLYPSHSDIEPVPSPELTFAVDVSEPFGVDQVVAVTSPQDLTDFARAVRRLDRRKASGDVLGLIEALAPGTVKVGIVGIATQP